MLNHSIEKKHSVSDYYQEAKSWYQENYESLQISRNRYRVFSCIMAFMMCLGLCAIITLLPLKQYIYRLIEVNKQTGEVTVLKEMEGNAFSANWIMTRYFINQYIEQRESYSLEEIKRKFNIVIRMSDKPLANKYIADTVDSNPKSPIKLLNNTHYKEVNVLSINSLNDNTALVRYQTRLHNKSEVNEVKTEDWQAVIKWKYVNDKASLNDRDKNPLGFTVTYYQVSPVFAEK